MMKSQSSEDTILIDLLRAKQQNQEVKSLSLYHDKLPAIANLVSDGYILVIENDDIYITLKGQRYIRTKYPALED